MAEIMPECQPHKGPDMAKTQLNCTKPLTNLDIKELQKALRLAAKNAHHMAIAFGLKVPTEKRTQLPK
jgi:hypothetical protein